MLSRRQETFRPILFEKSQVMTVDIVLGRSGSGLEHKVHLHALRTKILLMLSVNGWTT